MAYAPYLTRQFGYQQLKLAGLDTVVDPAKLDIELNAIVAAYNALVKRERAYTSPAGLVTQAPTAASLSLSSTTRFVATAAQTSFIVPTYTPASDTVEVWTGSAGAGMTMVDPNSVVKTDATHVTLPAQAVNTVVVILVFSSGAGVLATLAVDQTGGGTSGATLIGFWGSGLFTSHTVEGAMVEFKTAYNAFVASVGTVAGLVRANGTVAMAANLPMGTFKLTNLGPGTGAGDSVEYSQFSAFANVWNALQAYYAKLDGSTVWTGDWNAGNHKLTNLLAGVSANDAVIVSQLTLGSVQSGKNALINGLCAVAQGLDYVAAVAGTLKYGKVDGYVGFLSGTAVAGTLTQGVTTPPGSSGYSVKWSGLTLTGAGAATMRQYIEDVNSLRFIKKQGYVGVSVKHSALAAINVTINVYAANAVNNFAGGMTLIGTSTTSVATGVETRLTMTPLAGGFATAVNGVCVEVVFSTGACTAISCEAADWQYELGGYSNIEFEAYSVSFSKCQRYFTVFSTESTGNGLFGIGSAQTTNQAIIPLHLPTNMRGGGTGPIVGAGTSSASSFKLTHSGAAVACTGIGYTGPMGQTSVFYLSATTAAAALTADRPYILQAVSGFLRLEIDARLL